MRLPSWAEESGEELARRGITHRLWLVRHAETDREFVGRCYGRTDVALSAKGREQSRQLEGGLSASRATRLFSSPRARARITAQGLQTRVDLPLTVDEAFAEIDFGAFEGRSYDEIRHAYPSEYACWMRSPWEVRFPRGESHAQLRQRVRRGLDELIFCDAHRGVSLLVTHGGVIRAVLGVCLALPAPSEFALGVEYASLSCIDRYADSFVLRCLNWECVR